MKYIDIEDTQMPALGFGTWQLEGKACEHAVANALAIGYRHIDTAQIYENEVEVGRALAASGIARKELFITTKLWTTNFNASRVRSSADESLSKLKLDYVDLLLIHWPNPDVPLAETLGAMQELVAAKKVRHIGISNFPVALMEEAARISPLPIVCNQVEYHPLLSQKAVLEAARRHRMIVTAYSPLARGKLAGNAVLNRIAMAHGKTVGQVALNWLVNQPGVAAIPKAASEKHARENFQIFDFELTADERAAIDALQGSGRLINPSFAPQWDAA